MKQLGIFVYLFAREIRGREDLVSGEKALRDFRKDFAEKKFGLNDAFQDASIVQNNPSYPLFRHPVRRDQLSSDRNTETEEDCCRSPFFAFPSTRTDALALTFYILETYTVTYR